MKLTSRPHLVKPEPRTLAVAAVAAILTVAAVQAVLVATNQSEARMHRFGTAAARALAALALEPMMRQDRLHLGVIGNRLVETVEVRGVASYSADEELLATTGDMEGLEYSQAVVVDGDVVGYVRLTLHPPAFAEPDGKRMLALLLVALLVPVLVASAWQLVEAARSGALGAALPRRAHASPEPDPARPRTAPPTDEHRPPPEPPAEIRHYLLAVNLYNQLSLPRSEREFELSLCMELAEAVADVHRGQVVGLPGVGALVDFDDIDDADRPFDVLCASFLLGRLLQDESPFGHYRLGLNLAVRNADAALPLDDPAVADAALLSALARDGALAVSEPAARALDGDERYSSRPLVNPLLDELVTSTSACQLVTALTSPVAALVIQRAEQLKAHRDDVISSPSTL